MKQWMLRLMLVLILPLAALSCRPGEQGEQDRASDEVAIRALATAYESAVNQRDAAGIADLCTTDGDVIVYDQPRLVGRDAIRQAQEARFAALPATLRISLTVTHIRFLTPDLAIVETVATFNEGDIRENRGTSVVIRKGANWLHAALRVYAAQRQ